MSELDLDVIGVRKGPVTFSYTWRDVVLYALSVGATEEELSFIYENAAGGLQVLPSFCIVPSHRAFPDLGDLDMSRFVHGEQEIWIYEQLPREGSIDAEGEVTDIYDKGTGALYRIKVRGRNPDSGKELYQAEWKIFYLGAGGFGGKRGPSSEVPQVPEDREPDFSVCEQVPRSQAALYRLNGDYNPLHVDPEVARRGGFERPILHGLCTYGYAVRAVVNTMLGGDVGGFRYFGARFSRPVFPGDTLTTEIYRQESRNLLRVRTERGTVLSNGVLETSV